MIEIFAPREPQDPGACYFTIRVCDVGKRSIDTEVGRVDLTVVMGIVMARDIGRRLYRVADSCQVWIWQVENDEQFTRRKERERTWGHRHT